MTKQEVSVITPIMAKPIKRFLESRCIPLHLADRYCFEAVIYSEKRHHNIHYLGFLSNNFGLIYKSPWGVTGSMTVGITTITLDGIRCLEKTHTAVVVFSGFMDFLSYLALKGLDAPECDVIVLNGCSNVEKGMRFIRQHAFVFCYFSMDERGRKCQKYLEQNLEGCSIVDRSDRYEGEDDLNSLLIKKRHERTAPGRSRRRNSKSEKADKG